MKKFFSILCLAFLCLLGLCSCGGDKEEGQSYVSLDINPSIELMLSEDNKVLEVYAANDDAKVLLYGEESLTGMDIEEALEVITRLSMEYGYLTEDNKVIEYTVSTTLNTSGKENLEAVINAKVTDTASQNGLNVKLSAEGAFSLVRKLEKLKAENPDDALIQKLTASEYRLILSAQSSDKTLSLETALTLSDKELMDCITNARDTMYNVATAAYEELVAESQIAYETALKSFERSLYTAYYVKNIKNHPVNYGALYAMYGSAADTLERIVELSYTLDSVKNKLLSNEEIQNLIAKIKALGITEEEISAALKDDNGNITIDSVNSYLDKLIKNMDSESLTKEIEAIKETVNGIETRINGLIEKINEDYLPELEELLSVIKESCLQITAMVELLPESVKSVITAYLDEMEELVQIVEKAMTDCTVTDMQKWIETLRTKEKELFDKITSDLTEEELKEITDAQTNISNEVIIAKGKLESAVKTAKAEAEARLKDLKDKRS